MTSASETQKTNSSLSTEEILLKIAETLERVNKFDLSFIRHTQTWYRVNYDLYDGDNILKAEHIPEPFGWQMVIQPIYDGGYIINAEGNAVTEGGVHIPDTAKYREEYTNVQGKIVAMAGGCFRDRETGIPFPGNWPQLGDTVVYPQIAGDKQTVDGVRLRIMNDDEAKFRVIEGSGGALGYFKTKKAKQVPVGRWLENDRMATETKLLGNKEPVNVTETD